MLLSHLLAELDKKFFLELASNWPYTLVCSSTKSVTLYFPLSLPQTSARVLCFLQISTFAAAGVLSTDP